MIHSGVPLGPALPVLLFNSSSTFPGGRAKISYRCEQGPVVIWPAVEVKTNRLVHITTLEVASGGGKTTLVNLIYRYLRRDELPDDVQFSPRMRIQGNVAYIPQRPDSVRHWRVSELVPSSSPFTTSMFDETIEEFFEKKLSSFSGGQVARIFVASALHRISARPTPLSFLLLDEAFEGVDARLLSKALNGIARTWADNCTGKHLFILLVTHLDMKEVLGQFDLMLLDVNRVALTKERSEFSKGFETIPIIMKNIQENT